MIHFAAGVRGNASGPGPGPATVRLVPVEFLSDEQAEAYGRSAEEPTRPALQMCTVRHVGLFLEDPLAVPWPVVEHLAVQLGIEDPSCVKRYTERRQTLYDHAWEIRDAYGYHPYEDAERGRRFRTFLHGRAWTHAEGPKALFDHAVGRLDRWRRRGRLRRSGCTPRSRAPPVVRTPRCLVTWWRR